MNHRYGTDKINWQDFRDRLNRETASAQTRDIISAWLVGLIYLLIGTFCWREWMSQCDWIQQIVWALVMLVSGPILLGMNAGLSRLLGNWPCCPSCGRKIYSPTPVLASKHCPHCHAYIIKDNRELSPEYVYCRTTMNTNFLRAIRIILITPPLTGILSFAFGLIGEKEFEPMMEAMVSVMGGGIIGMMGIAPLISASWMIRVCIFLRLIPKDKFIYCPECGCIPSAYVARMSGCCSECGAKLLEIPDDPDTPEMLDWHLLKQYYNWNIRGIVGGYILMYVCFVPMITLKWWWLLWLLGTMACVVVIQNFRLKRLAEIPKKCPHCTQLLDRTILSLLHYGRCPNCRCKLVHDDDPGKGDDHA